MLTLESLRNKEKGKMQMASDLAHAYWENEVDFQITNNFNSLLGVLTEKDINNIKSEIAQEILLNEYVWGIINETISESIEEKIEQTKFSENVRKHFGDILEDDGTSKGGTEREGEQLIDFLSYWGEHDGMITDEEVNKALVKSGIKPIKF